MEKFDFNTIQKFDEHISLSVSHYEVLDDIIVSLASNFITPNSNVYDLGCSTGRMLRVLDNYNRVDGVSFVGYDISENLLPKIIGDSLSFFKRDITDPTIKFYNTDLILSIFTLQFIAREKRQALVKKVYDSLNPGGAFIVTEKIYMADGRIQDHFNFAHYDFKRRTFSPDAILSKQIDLRTIMRPLNELEIAKMFKIAGFSTVESFYQSLNFKGWILIK